MYKKAIYRLLIFGCLLLFSYLYYSYQSRARIQEQYNRPHIATNFDRDSAVVIQNEVFWVSYSIDKEQPLQLSYRVACPTKGVNRKGKDFYEVDSVHTSDDADYYNNIWDKGHLAPSASFDCSEELQWMTFSYLNCALQHQKLNRGVWARLENLEREWALHCQVDVLVKCIFTDTSLRLETGAVVPDGFVKEIVKCSDTLKFYFPNRSPISGKPFDYQIN